MGLLSVGTTGLLESAVAYAIHNNSVKRRDSVCAPSWTVLVRPQRRAYEFR